VFPQVAASLVLGLVSLFNPVPFKEMVVKPQDEEVKRIWAKITIYAKFLCWEL
jgi:hypothetical protein